MNCGGFFSLSFGLGFFLGDFFVVVVVHVCLKLLRSHFVLWLEAAVMLLTSCSSGPFNLQLI